MHTNFVVYKSSAGSGKTYTLVKEYLKLALANPHQLHKAYKQILAVTFTNKAAAEMKERILVALQQISSFQKIALATDLQNELYISESELATRCQILHTNLLHQYADFSVCTIDSFVYRLVKRFSIDLQLPANFTVETDEDAALWWAIDALLTNMEQNKQLQNLLLSYASEKVDEQKNWKIENEIFSLVKPILVSKKDSKEAEILGKVTLHDLIEIKKELRTSVHQTENYFAVLADKAYQLLSKNNVSIEDFRYGKSGVFSYFRKIKDNIFDEDELINSYVRQAIYEDKWYTGKVANANIDSIKQDVITIFNEIETYRKQHASNYYLHKLLLKNINALCVLNEVNALVHQYKEEKGIVFISEFNKAVSSFIQDEPVPFIYERLGDRYKHYLIDEFQDTSSLQWLNLLPLVHNSLSEGKFCMIVGDGKQSIYRWRGADVEQFVNLPKVQNPLHNEFVYEQEKALELNYVEKQLNTNRRSCAEIITFNNNLFEWLSKKYLTDKHQKVYENCAQQAASKQGGKITISFVENSVEEKNEKVLQESLKLIHDSLEKNYSYSDIAILTRNNRHGSEVAQFLMHQGIPVVSSDSLLLKTCAEVNFLISFLTWLSNNNDAVAGCATLSYVKENLQYKVTHHHFRDAATTPYKLNEIYQSFGVPLNTGHLASLPLFEICTEAIRLFKIENKNSLFVNFFLDEVASFNEKENASVFLFLQWWHQKSDNISVKIPQNTNAVKVLTIHASKGLEFPIVILPFADWRLQAAEQILIDTNNQVAELPVALVRTGTDLKRTSFKNESIEEEQKQLLDNLNVLYVACTRAVDGLHIISREKKMGNCVTNWLQFFVKEKSIEFTNERFELGSYPAKEKSNQAEIPTLQPVSYRYLHETVQIKLSDFEINNQTRRQYGIALHSILENIKTQEHIIPALQKALLQGNIAKYQFEELQQLITELTNHPELKIYFSDASQVKTETELFLDDVEIIRPDRIVISPQHLAVIDFKTGEKLGKHIKQLQVYKQTLHKITNKHVKAFLVYLPGEVVEVI